MALHAQRLSLLVRCISYVHQDNDSEVIGQKQQRSVRETNLQERHEVSCGWLWDLLVDSWLNIYSCSRLRRKLCMEFLKHSWDTTPSLRVWQIADRSPKSGPFQTPGDHFGRSDVLRCHGAAKALFWGRISGVFGCRRIPFQLIYNYISISQNRLDMQAE